MSERTESHLNKDLILREKLALQRTVMANQTTLLSFLRTGMYFIVAGLSMKNLLKVAHSPTLELLFYGAAGIILVIGIFNYFLQKKKIRESRKHIGNYRDEYLNH